MNSTCKCYDILSYLKQSNPKDFCNNVDCEIWKNLSQCNYCSTKTQEKKYCPNHLKFHKIIKCYYCLEFDCKKKFSRTDNNLYACYECVENYNQKKLKNNI